MLTAGDLHAGYGSAEVLHGVSLRVGVGEIVALLGANGAGKTTTLRCLAGALRPARGEIRIEGHVVHGRSPADLARIGVGYVPEGRGIARSLTVGENLRLGGYLLRRDAAAYRRQLDRVHEMFPVLRTTADQRAGTLSGGQQQMLAIGRALMGAPKLLLVDEASLGLAPIIIDTLYDSLATLNDAGMALLVVEQNPGRILPIAHRAYVLQKGQVVLEGTADEVRRSDLLLLYLGEAPVTPIQEAPIEEPFHDALEVTHRELTVATQPARARAPKPKAAATAAKKAPVKKAAETRARATKATTASRSQGTGAKTTKTTTAKIGRVTTVEGSPAAKARRPDRAG